MATKQVTVRINGMTCASCVARIEQTLRQHEGIIWANVNFAAGQVMLTYDPTAFSLAKLSKAVNELGYELQASGEAETPVIAPATAPHLRAAGLWRPVTVAALAALTVTGLYFSLSALSRGWQHAGEQLWTNGWLAAVVIASSAVLIAHLITRGRTAS